MHISGTFAVILAASCAVSAAKDQQKIDRQCFDCMRQVENGGVNVTGCEDGLGGMRCGNYHVHLPYYEDCGAPGKSEEESLEKAWKRCSAKDECAEECIQKYMDRYAAACQGGKPTCETFARVHNGGIKGCKTASTKPYWENVKKCLDGQ